MKRQTLLISSALLATTALSTAATAGTIVPTAAAGAILATSFTPLALAAQVFGGTTPETLLIGGSDSGAEISLDFTNSLTTTFDMRLDPAGAQFTGTTVDVLAFAEDTAGTLVAEASLQGCTVQVLTDRILVEDCLTGTATTAIDVLMLTGIQFNEANGLATVGASISISGQVTGASGGSTFETITSAAIVTSADALKVVASAGGTGTLLNTATPAFATLTGGATTLSLGSVNNSLAATVGTDLSTAVAGTQVTAAVELTVTHGVLTDSATTQLVATASGTPTRTTVIASNFNSNVASFDFALPADLLGSFDISVVFNGTTAIQNWSAGTIDAVFTIGSVLAAAPASATGSLAALSRGGMSVQINTANSSVAGGTQFQSLVRIVNNGTVAGAATIVVRNDADGTTLGTFTTGDIAAGATLQVDMPTIEGATGITPAGQYGLTVSGAFTGYAQHVMFNSVDSLFVDLSGFRIGAGANNP
jgi:hypothetical protein